MHAVVITGANGLFSGGADINDFSIEPAAGSKTVRDAIAMIERSENVYIAAIEKTALGGALELALVCDYRIARAGARIGFPEIKLGIFPGAGGTQRLPRILGANDALQFMLKGDAIGAAEAHEKGILDEVVDGDPLPAALVRAVGPKRRLSARKAELGIPGMGLFAAPFALAQAHKMVPAEERGGYAAHKLIDAVDAALERDFARGIAREERLFEECVRSSQSSALRHLFFAERELPKVPGLPPAKPLPIATAGIVGAGTMGTGIAIAFADAGIPVTVIDPDPAAIERAKQTVQSTFAYNVSRGRLSAEEGAKRGQAIRVRDRLRRACRVDIVIEAVFENMDVKNRCSKSSMRSASRSDPRQQYLDTRHRCDGGDDQAPGAGPRSALLRTGEYHEAARSDSRKDTSPQTLVSGIALAKKLRKVGVVSGNAFGFIGNSMFFEYERQAAALVEEGVSPTPRRPRAQRLRLPDGAVCGGRSLRARRVSLHRAGRRRAVRAHPAGRDARRARTQGQKTGQGFFRYDKAVGGGREAIPDPEVEKLIDELARAAGIASIPTSPTRRSCGARSPR